MIEKVKSKTPAVMGIFAFVIFIFFSYRYIEFDKDMKEKNQRSQLLELLILKKSELEKSISSRIYYTKGIAAYVSLNPDITESEYQNLAKELINGDTIIKSMSLAKDGVINSIYPKKGLENVIGLDLLQHPERLDIVKQTIKTGKTFVAGPVELIEGGIAFISYTPIFNKTKNDSGQFWGMTDIVIKRDELFAEANLEINDSENYYALKGEDGKGKQGDSFWGKSEIFSKNPVTIKISLPTGNWVLASVPVNGWNSNENSSLIFYIILFSASLIISILIWLLSKAWIRIKNNESELSALFGAMNDLVIIFDSKGYYRNIAPTNNHLLLKPAKELINKSLYDIFDENTARFFHDAILKSINTKKTVQIEYPLEINQKELWFLARISYISQNSVIYVAHDNTEKKLVELNLQKSENELKDTNAMKDKFFSIIAHDLKNPISSFRNSTELLFDNYSDFTETEKYEFIEQLKDTSESLYSLLENLLEWSRVQRGAIKPEFVKSNILFLLKNSILHLKCIAENKKIEIRNNIKEDIYCLCDPNMIATIFRNIISNAIKFTNENGIISIDYHKEILEKKNYHSINISDTGIGISKSRIDKLFRIDTATSTPGTNQEKGTGFGLVLCKDFADMNNAHIKVESKTSEGSTFKILIPENN